MAIGPVQLLVLGFQQPDFSGEIREELDRLRDNDLTRVIDALAVRKDADGNVEVLHESQLSADQQQAFGALVGGLIGLARPARRASRSGPSAAPRPSPNAAGCSTRTRPGTYSPRSLPTPPAY
jgi:hypothetical protein